MRRQSFKGYERMGNRTPGWRSRYLGTLFALLLMTLVVTLGGAFAWSAEPDPMQELLEHLLSAEKETPAPEITPVHALTEPAASEDNREESRQEESRKDPRIKTLEYPGRMSEETPHEAPSPVSPATLSETTSPSSTVRVQDLQPQTTAPKKAPQNTSKSSPKSATPQSSKNTPDLPPLNPRSETPTAESPDKTPKTTPPAETVNQPPKPVEKQTQESEAAKPTKPEPLSTQNPATLNAAAERSAVETESEKGRAQDKEEQDKEQKKEKEPKPRVIYQDLPAIAVFPIIKHGTEKAFGDVAILFSNEFSNRLEQQFPNTRIHNPVYSLESLRVRGYGRIYDQMVDYYVKAGRPEQKALAYLLDQLDEEGVPVHRVVFIEADVDLHHQTRSWRPKDVFKKFHSESLPNEQRYYVMSRIKVYDTSVPHHPMIWSFTWNHPVKTTGLYNVTASVFQDSDSIDMFSLASRVMSRIVMAASPKAAYQKGITVIGTEVQGEIQGKIQNEIQNETPTSPLQFPAGATSPETRSSTQPKAVPDGQSASSKQ